MKKARLSRIIVRSASVNRYVWELYAPNGRNIAASTKVYPTQRAAVQHLEALAAKGVLGNAVVVAG
jgi:uncharacterized protein YegP (UPF0339 family)